MPNKVHIAELPDEREGVINDGLLSRLKALYYGIEASRLSDVPQDVLHLHLGVPFDFVGARVMKSRTNRYNTGRNIGQEVEVFACLEDGEVWCYVVRHWRLIRSRPAWYTWDQVTKDSEIAHLVTEELVK